jgi:primosomal protein N' (replication factor Y)
VKGFQNSIPVILGTATPSLETKLNVANKRYQVGYLPDRINDMPLPEIKLIDLKDKNIMIKDSSISKPLKELITEKLKNREQVIIYLNKRGYHSNLLCKECGYSFKCDNCDISYTYYKYQNVLKCHYCDAMKTKVDSCPECGSFNLINLSIGTEKITEELEELFPDAKIERFDRDIVKTHKKLSDIIKSMKKKEIDILIGTQMVVKGHHFPNVTLVALLVADQGLHFPNIRAVERTFQDLVQVSGRAGRADKKGIVVLQAYNTQHYAIQYFINNQFEEFWNYELEWRKALDYPPYFKFVKIIFSSKNRELLEGEIIRIKQYRPITTNFSHAKKAPIYKIKNVYRFLVEISSESPQFVMKELKNFYTFIENLKINQNVRVIIDRDPM